MDRDTKIWAARVIALTITLCWAHSYTDGAYAAPVVIAHRGDVADGPENTLPAINRAIGSGAEGIELDVRYSKPSATWPVGVPVLMHDATVDRTTTCTGAVSGLTATALAACDAGFDAGYTPTGVPTLYAAMSAIVDAEYSGELQVELKTVQTPAQAALTLNRIRRFGLDDQVTFTSFSRPALAAIRAAGWTGRTGWIFRQADASTAWNLAEYSDLIPYGVLVYAEDVEKAHANGVRVTVGSESYSRSVVALGADYLIVNQLDVTLAVRQAVAECLIPPSTNASVRVGVPQVTP
jgi:glycerophosphoryl diester phosphodiesterase